MRDILRAIVGLCALAATMTQASSAVAVAVNRNGGLGYGYSHTSNVTEAEIKRRAIQERYVDWFRFWLKGEEDPDPAKAEQYKRWRELRKMQVENEKKASASQPALN